jgi:hypothetical protein
MQHEAYTVDRGRTGRAVANVPFDEPEVRPIGIGQQPFDFLKVAPMSGREIVEANNPLPRAQQRLNQVGTDETGGAGDQPGAVGLGKSRGKVFV